MINYIKTHKLTADDLTKTEAVLWSDDKYMKPVEVDPWLMFGKNHSFLSSRQICNFELFPVDIEDLKDAKSDSTTNDAHKIESLQRELREKDAMIEQLLEQITHMKTMMSSNFHEWVDRLEKSSSPSTANGTTEKADSGEKTVAKIPIEDDESYFVTYAHFDIHYNMLSVSQITKIIFSLFLQTKKTKIQKIIEIFLPRTLFVPPATETPSSTIVIHLKISW